MLTTISTQKRFFFFPFLAFFYLTIGAHALHPYFHEHPVDQPELSGQHSAHEGHHVHSEHPSVSYGVSVVSDHNSCPICIFIAVNLAANIGSVYLSTPSLPDQRLDPDWRSIYLISQRSAILIRGPPFLQFI